MAYIIIGTSRESIFISNYDLSDFSTDDKRNPQTWHAESVGTQLLMKPEACFETCNEDGD